LLLALRLLKPVATMTPKPDHQHKSGPLKPLVRKPEKATTDSGRLFVNVEELIRRSQRLPLTRYVE
jgi:hypothetical protein